MKNSISEFMKKTAAALMWPFKAVWYSIVGIAFFVVAMVLWATISFGDAKDGYGD